VDAHAELEALTFDDLMPVETSFWIVRIEQTHEQILNVRIEDDRYSQSMTLPAGGLYRTYDLQFAGYLAVSIKEELQGSSFEGVREGHRFQRCRDTDFLKYIKASMVVEANFDQVTKHFGVYCLNGMIDVATCFEPTVTLVRVLAS